MAQQQGLYSVNLFGADGKRVGNQELISARTAASAVKKAISIHNDFSKRYGGTQIAVRGKVRSTLIDGKLTRHNPTDFPNVAAVIMPLIDEDGAKPKILWSVMYDLGDGRKGQEFSNLHSAKTWARARFGKITVKPLAKKYEKFLRNPAPIKNAFTGNIGGGEMVYIEPRDINAIALHPNGRMSIQLSSGGHITFDAKSIRYGNNLDLLTGRQLIQVLMRRYKLK